MFSYLGGRPFPQDDKFYHIPLHHIQRDGDVHTYGRDSHKSDDDDNDDNSNNHANNSTGYGCNK
jgi:hypothetical protein